MNRAIVGQLNTLQIKQKRSTRCNSCFQLLHFDYEMLSRESQLRNFRFFTNLRDNLIPRTKQLLQFFYLFIIRHEGEKKIFSLFRYFAFFPSLFSWSSWRAIQLKSSIRSRNILFEFLRENSVRKKWNVALLCKHKYKQVWIKLNKDRLTGIFAFHDFRVVKREKASRDRVLEI